MEKMTVTLKCNVNGEERDAILEAGSSPNGPEMCQITLFQASSKLVAVFNYDRLLKAVTALRMREL